MRLHQSIARPLRILLDARMLVGRFSGISRFVTSLADAITARGDCQVIALCGNERPNCWADRSDLEIVTTNFDRSMRTPWKRWYWEETQLRRYVRRAQADVFHATWNFGIPPSCPIPALLTLHDLIPWHDSQSHFAHPFDRWCYRSATRRSLRRAAMISTVSEWVQTDLLQTLQLDSNKVVTVPNGVGPCDTVILSPSPALRINSAKNHNRHEPARSFAPLSMTTLGRNAAAEFMPKPAARDYVLYVGGHHPRKNVVGALRAMQAYWNKFDDPLEIRLTGKAEFLSPEAARAYSELQFPERVRFLGDPDDRELAELYSNATVLLFLSCNEGFGLPVLEAFAHGCPVVAAANASLPEVVGDAGVLVDPFDLHAVAGAIRKIVMDRVHRGTLIEHGRARARLFSWSATAERFVGIYQAISGVQKSRPSNVKLWETSARAHAESG